MRRPTSTDTGFWNSGESNAKKLHNEMESGRMKGVPIEIVYVNQNSISVLESSVVTRKLSGLYFAPINKSHQVPKKHGDGSS